MLDELHVGLPMLLSVYYELVFIAVIGYSILFTHIAQTDDVGNCIRAVPDSFMEPWQGCFLGDAHRATVAFQPERFIRLSDVLYKLLVADHRRRRLTVQ